MDDPLQPVGIEAVINRMIADNCRYFERARELGGVAYPIGTIPFDREDWTRQFGPVWGNFARAKQRFNPDHVLTPGQGIFNG